MTTLGLMRPAVSPEARVMACRFAWSDLHPARDALVEGWVLSPGWSQPSGISAAMDWEIGKAYPLEAEGPDGEMVYLGEMMTYLGELTLEWDPLVHPCMSTTRYQVFAASTATPTNVPGEFPADPAWTALGMTTTESFSYPADPARFATARCGG